MRIGFLPIDNRPVCYLLPEQIANIDKSVELLLPKREYLGDLTKPAKIDKLFEWLENLTKVDVIILSLDTITYGGLIPSRRCSDSFEDIKNRVLELKNILKTKNTKIYATSSIMRISNNNYNEEEKEYWKDYGEDIFKYSYELHKNNHATTNVPDNIIEDYLDTRKRNFEINKLYLELQKEGLFDFLIFSKDDCSQFGLNVKEAQKLEELGGFTKTGADEIPLSLLSKSLNKEIKICPIFLEPEYKNLISNYEDVSIETSVIGQIELAGCKVTNKNDADILLFVNNFKNRQGEIVMKVDTERFSGEFLVPNKPYMIADVRFANGADNNFVNELLNNVIEDEYFYGYSAWNTSANSLGSLIATAKFKFMADRYDKNSFKLSQITRFLDDWAYQANVRQKLKTVDKNEIKILMKPYEDVLKQIFGYNFELNYSFPWNRLFEVEIEFN